MSIFDTIIDGVSSLFDSGSDDIYGASGDATLGGSSGSKSSSGLTDILGAAAKGYTALQTQAQQRLSQENSLESQLMKNAAMANTKNNYKPDTNQKYGEPNYSANFASIQSQWLGYLQGVAGNSKVVPGERYTHEGVA